MPQFRKKPVEVEARLFFDVKSGADIWDWANGPISLASDRTDDGGFIPKLEIETLEGVMVAALGDWVVKGIKGEFYPVKPDIFKATYEAVTVHGGQEK